MPDVIAAAKQVIEMKAALDRLPLHSPPWQRGSADLRRFLFANCVTICTALLEAQALIDEIRRE